MRGWLIIAALLPWTAEAGLVEDCSQSGDWWLRVRACTEAIDSGRWEGRRAAWAYSNRAVAYGALGNYIAAFDDHERAVQLDPTDARARNNKANSHAEFREYDRALREYGRALDLNPGYTNARFNRADVLLTMGRHADAAADFSAVLADDPDLAEAHAGRAAARCQMGDVTGSIADRLAALDGGALTEAAVSAYLEEKGYLRDGTQFGDALGQWTEARCP